MIRIFLAIILSSIATICFATQEFPLPGNSVASIDIQKKAYTELLPKMAQRLYECKSEVRVTNTEFETFWDEVGVTTDKKVMKNGMIANMWKEYWTFSGCNMQTRVPVEFYPAKPDPRKGIEFYVY